MSGSYLDFEPECQYRKGEANDIIEFQVKDFRKDQLKVHFKSNGVLAVSGERPQEGTKLIRFHKEFNCPKDCKANEIRARLSSGILYITIPKKVAPQLSQQDPLTPVQRAPSLNQDEGKLKQESSQESSQSKEVANAGDSMNSPNENATLILPEAGTKSFISRLKMGRKTGLKVVASVAVLSLLFTLLFYVYKFYAPMTIHV